MRGISRGRMLALLGVIVVAGLATQASVALAVAPTVATQAATGVTIQAATLHGTVNPRSLATSYVFQYGPTAAYGAQTAPASLAAGAAAVRVTGAAGALVPATTYHFRLVATNATGTSVTADRTFRTPAQALGVRSRRPPTRRRSVARRRSSGPSAGRAPPGARSRSSSARSRSRAASPTSATPS